MGTEERLLHSGTFTCEAQVESPILVDPVFSPPLVHLGQKPALKIVILMVQHNPVKLLDGGLAHADREADLATGCHMRR